MAIAMYEADGTYQSPWVEQDSNVQEWYRDLATAAVVALMEATVTEPCATCGDKHWICTIPEDEAAHEHNRCNHDPGRCPDCPSPRSLAVRECERAGLLRFERQGHTMRDDLTTDPFRLLRETPLPPSPTEREEPKR
jgi:hypothetical protein